MSEQKTSSLGRSLLRSLLVVMPTYCLVAWATTRGIDNPFEIESNGENISIIGRVGIVLLFTLSHGVIPVFFYRLFLPNPAERKRLGGFSVFINLFVTLHMGFWYGVPIIGLAVMTGGFTVVWDILHVLLAGKGNRRWVFLQHGSTTMALLLFVVCFSAGKLFPIGIIVVILQSLLLTLVEWKGRGLWINNAQDPPSDNA